MRPLALVAAVAAISCSTPVAPPSTATPPQGAPATGGAASPTDPMVTPPRTSADWSRIADIPTPRSEVAAAFHSPSGSIYVIGGFGGPARVERFTAAARWERVADLPHGVDHPMAAAVSGIQTAGDEGVYVMGGYVSGNATARSFRFDPTSGRWSEIAPMPAPRAAAAAVAMGPRIYVVGGADAGRLTPSTYEYDVTRRTWRTVASIPTPRDHLAAAEFEGKVCAIGGRRLSMSANLGTFECYSLQDDKWESLPAAPTPRGGVGAAAWDRRLYLIGGEQPSGTFREVEIYDATTGQWTRGPDLPTPRHGIGVVVVRGFSNSPPWGIYVLTGGPTPGGSQTPVCELLTLR